VRVEVVVRTRKVGHFFPGGTVDAFDVWVELEAVDDKAKRFFTAVKSKTVAAARSSRGTFLSVFNWTNTAIRSTSATRG
jgi:hypothetical protein